MAAKAVSSHLTPQALNACKNWEKIGTIQIDEKTYNVEVLFYKENRKGNINEKKCRNLSEKSKTKLLRGCTTLFTYIQKTAPATSMIYSSKDKIYSSNKDNAENEINEDKETNFIRSLFSNTIISSSSSTHRRTRAHQFKSWIDSSGYEHLSDSERTNSNFFSADERPFSRASSRHSSDDDENLSYACRLTPDQ